MTLKFRSRNCGIAALILGAGSLTLGSRSEGAVVLMDQIGSTPSLITNQEIYLSSVFTSAGFTGYTSALVDDFNVTGPTVLNDVMAVFGGYSNFTSFSVVRSWYIEVYSSLTAAHNSVLGNIYNHNFATSAVSFTTPYGGQSDFGLFNASTSITIPAAGTYYIAVVANEADINSGVVGVVGATDLINSNPGGLNTVQENPGGSLGYSGNAAYLTADAAYRIVGTPVSVPEPASCSVLAIAGSVLTLSRRRRA